MSYRKQGEERCFNLQIVGSLDSTGKTFSYGALTLYIEEAKYCVYAFFTI